MNTSATLYTQATLHLQIYAGSDINGKSSRSALTVTHAFYLLSIAIT